MMIEITMTTKTELQPMSVSIKAAINNVLRYILCYTLVLGQCLEMYFG